jgi:short-subunit dehydrogenase
VSTRAIVITGGSKGLGRAVAQLAWGRGYSVALIARGKEALEAAAQTLPSRGAQRCSVHPVDLVDEAATGEAFATIGREHAEAFALVNNAGTWAGRSPVRELSTAKLREALDLNLFSALHATQAFLRLPTELPHRAVVNVGATSSLRGGENVFAFSAGKMALRGMSQSLAKESWKDGVHVAHVVVDGLLDSERTLGMNPNFPDHRFLKCESVAATILHAIEQDPSCWTFEWDVRNRGASW